MANAKDIIVVGGDGFCGLPTALNLLKLGHNITIVDNLSHRVIDAKMRTDSLTPIASMEDRLKAWKEQTGLTISFLNLDVSRDFEAVMGLLADIKPDTIIHFGEQRAAPYSMKAAAEKRYTVDNNITGTHNLLAAAVALGQDPQFVHLGTMGVYGYDDDGLEIPEGYLPVYIPGDDKREQINFVSVDSAPKRFAGPVTIWQAPKMLVLFTALSAGQLF